MKKFDYMEKYGYEQLVFFHDESTGLKGITCIHNTTLGPSLGGTRLWNYETEEEATLDVLRLARGMTYKAAASGLNLGGGKSVLIGDPEKVKSEAYFRAFGRYVQTLGGRYITAPDVNTSAKDMKFINLETDSVVAIPEKSGNPSPATAWGAFHGIRASLKEKFGDDDISQYTYAVQGAGQTGDFLIGYLREANAKKIYFTEINDKHIEKIKKKYPDVEFVDPDDIYGFEVDVFAPCALGAVINDKTLKKIKAPIVAGTANNVLEDEDKHGKAVQDQGILYAPDFVINAGGLINVSHELTGYEKKKAFNEIEQIYDRLLEIYQVAKEDKVTTTQAAKIFAERRIERIDKIHANYIKK